MELFQHVENPLGSKFTDSIAIFMLLPIDDSVIMHGLVFNPLRNDHEHGFVQIDFPQFYKLLHQCPESAAKDEAIEHLLRQEETGAPEMIELENGPLVFRNIIVRLSPVPWEDRYDVPAGQPFERYRLEDWVSVRMAPGTKAFSLSDWLVQNKVHLDKLSGPDQKATGIFVELIFKYVYYRELVQRGHDKKESLSLACLEKGPMFTCARMLTDLIRLQNPGMR